MQIRLRTPGLCERLSRPFKERQFVRLPLRLLLEPISHNLIPLQNLSRKVLNLQIRSSEERSNPVLRIAEPQVDG